MKNLFHRPRPRLLLGLGAAAALSLASCGDDHPPGHHDHADAMPAVPVANVIPASGPVEIDPCTLVTAEEAAAVLGELGESPARTTSSVSVRACRFSPRAGGTLTLEIYGSAQWELQRQLDTGDTTGIEGLGDEAYHVAKGDDLHLWARKGVHVLHVVTTVGVDKAKALAARALARL